MTDTILNKYVQIQAPPKDCIQYKTLGMAIIRPSLILESVQNIYHSRRTHKNIKHEVDGGKNYHYQVYFIEYSGVIKLQIIITITNLFK